MNRWGKTSFAILLALSAAACTGVVSHVNGNGPGAPIAPSITTQPVNLTVTAGQTATFSVAATGTAPLTYQWQKNAANISGATSASYTTPATASSDNGSTFGPSVKLSDDNAFYPRIAAGSGGRRTKNMAIGMMMKQRGIIWRGSLIFPVIRWAPMKIGVIHEARRRNRGLSE